MYALHVPQRTHWLALNSKRANYAERCIPSASARLLCYTYWLAAALAWPCCQIAAQALPAEVSELPADTRYYATPATRSLRPWQSLNLHWVLHLDGTSRVVKAPFLARGTTALHASIQLYQHQLPKDTLYVLFEALAGRPIVYLNSRVVATSPQAIGTLLIPLQPDLWQVGWNTLQVHLSQRDTDSLLLPRGVLGIYQPAFVLIKGATSLADSLVVPWPAATTAAPVPIFTWLNLKTNSQLADSLWVPQVRALFSGQIPASASLQMQPYPGRAVVRRLHQLGIRWQPSTYASASQILAASPTHDTPTAAPSLSPTPLTRPIALAIAFVPLVLLVVWRLYDVASFRLVIGVSVQRAKTFEMISQNIFLRPTLLLLVSALRVALLAASLVFWYYLYLLQGEYVVWPVGHSSLADAFLNTLTDRPMRLFGMLLLGFVTVNAGKYIMLHILGQIYNRRYFFERMLALEAYAYLPWLALLCSLGFVIHTLPATATAPLYFITLAVFVFFVLRKYYIFITGLAQALRIPLTIIFLYICTFEIIPWFWLLLN